MNCCNYLFKISCSLYPKLSYFTCYHLRDVVRNGFLKYCMYIQLFICLGYSLNFFTESIFRYFDLDLGRAQEIIKELISSEDKWNTNEFPEMKQDLLNKLKI